jgi:imidazolonepropionase-like amidohydrolase
LKPLIKSLVAILIAACSPLAFADSPNPGLTGAPYHADSGSILVRCGALIDGRSDEVLNDVSVLIEEGRFSRIGTQVETPPGVGVLDLAEYTCLPGLIIQSPAPMEAIQAATSVAARYLGWEDRVGAIEPGLLGDLVAVKGNPLGDISILENIEAVVKGGLVFKAPTGKTR